MVQLGLSLVLTFTYFNTIIEEIFFISSSSSPNITILEQIQSIVPLERSYSTIYYGLIITMLLLMSSLKISHRGIFIVYVVLLKFFESLPLVFDLINLFLIYQYKIEHVEHHYSWHRWYLTFVLIAIRFLLSLNSIRRKYADNRLKRQMIVLVDLLLFILINISLLRDSTSNLIRIGRKVVLGALIFHLNYLFYNENFWSDHRAKSVIERRDSKSSTTILHIILYLRLILSIVILGLFFLYEPSGSAFVLYLIILSMIDWDTMYERKILNQYGIERFATGLDLKPKESIKSTQPTCVVCFDELQFNYLDMQLTSACQHANRTVCDNCVFRHVQQTIQITFTDDISCPEQNCNVMFDYQTVRNILLLGGDPDLINRYDRYVFQRQLEQMEEFIWCANPTCHAGQLNQGGRSNNVVTCYNCHQKTCFQHKVQWHEGLSCEEYDLCNDPKFESSRQWIMQNSKKCPQCPYRIEKNQGCDHMTCIKCRHEFCWSCLADYQPIRQQGSHRHLPTCKHYV